MSGVFGGFTSNPFAHMAEAGEKLKVQSERTLYMDALADTANGVVSKDPDRKAMQDTIKAYTLKHIALTTEIRPGLHRSSFKHLTTVEKPDTIRPPNWKPTTEEDQVRFIATAAHQVESGNKAQCDTFTMDELLNDRAPTEVGFNPEVPAYGTDGRGNEVFYLHVEHPGTMGLLNKLLDYEEDGEKKPGTHRNPIQIQEDAQSWARSALLSTMLQVPPEELRKTLTAALEANGDQNNPALINDMVTMATALQDPNGAGLQILVGKDANDKDTPITLTLPGEKSINIETYIPHLVDHLLKGNSPTKHDDTESHATNVFSLMKALGATGVLMHTDSKKSPGSNSISAIMTNGPGVLAKASQIPDDDTGGHASLMRNYFNKPILLKVGNSFLVYPTNPLAPKVHVDEGQAPGETPAQNDMAGNDTASEAGDAHEQDDASQAGEHTQPNAPPNRK